MSSGNSSSPFDEKDFPTRPFFVDTSSLLFGCVEAGVTDVRRVPGEVGGRAIGAELME